jgi:hypothetical protein
MNERIKELAKQAGHRYYPSSNSGPLRVEYLTPEFEKFAELIVEECIDIALKKKLEQLELVSDTKAFDSMPEGAKDHSFGRVVAINQVVADIKQHFGVQE